MREYWISQAANWLALVRLNSSAFGPDTPQTRAALDHLRDAVTEIERHSQPRRARLK